MKTKATVTDKSGAKHTPMSRARDLARAAVKKNVKEETITESRLADIVREAAEKAKKKKKEETKKSEDTFQADPELSSQIIRND
jgi:16S rRNA C1402 N4-methylase RsmH